MIDEEWAQFLSENHFYQRNGFAYIQLIPCMDEQTRGISKGHNQYAVDHAMHGQSMDIRMFSNPAQMAAGYPAEECGMNGCRRWRETHFAPVWKVS